MSKVLPKKKEPVSKRSDNSIAFVGRQPIFDKHLNVYAFELLFRNSHNQTADFEHADTASLELINNSLLEIGLNNIIQDKLAFINVTRNVLMGPELPLSRDRIILELLEDITYDDLLVEKIKNMKTEGYRFALDDFVFEQHHENVFDFVSIVKLDILESSKHEIENEVKRFKKINHIRLLAEKIETMEEFEYCQNLGFDYFQGYFLSRPNIVQGKKVSSSQLSILKLLGKAHDANVKIDELEKIISSDVTLSYRLLKMINSSYYGVNNKVKSVNHALVMLGLDKIRRWVSLVALSCSNNGPSYLMQLALIRAMMAQSLIQSSGLNNDSDTAYTIGLFSVLPYITKMPMDEILENISLSDEINQALLLNEGVQGKILSCVIAYEKAEWNKVQESGFSKEELKESYFTALQYSQTTLSQMH